VKTVAATTFREKRTSSIVRRLSRQRRGRKVESVHRAGNLNRSSATGSSAKDGAGVTESASEIKARLH